MGSRCAFRRAGAAFGGQRSLVGINRLLLAQPKVWLLDEPTSSLDQNTETAALDAIDAQLGEDSILVMVTHKMPLLSRFERVLVMADGKIVSDAPARDILREFVARQVPQKPQAEAPTGTVTSRAVGRQAS